MLPTVVTTLPSGESVDPLCYICRHIHNNLSCIRILRGCSFNFVVTRFLALFLTIIIPLFSQVVLVSELASLGAVLMARVKVCLEVAFVIASVSVLKIAVMM